MLEIKITATAKDGTPLGAICKISDQMIDQISVGKMVEIASVSVQKVVEAYLEVKEPS